jgi:hypothetical protein
VAALLAFALLAHEGRVGCVSRLHANVPATQAGDDGVAVGVHSRDAALSRVGVIHDAVSDESASDSARRRSHTQRDFLVSAAAEDHNDGVVGEAKEGYSELNREHVG